MKRRGNIKVIAGAFDNLSDGDRTKLLDKVKEKLMEKIKNKDNTEEQSNTEEQDNTEEQKSATVKFVASNGTGKGDKDRDLMSDTGGKVKHKVAPKLNPSRDDSTKRYNYDKINKKDRVDYKDTIGDPDLKVSSRRGKHK